VRILLVEDDRALGDGIRAGLKLAGYAVDWAGDGDSALLALTTQQYDVCVLDIGLPGKDGISVLRTLRGNRSCVPVLLLTARDTPAERIAGLDAGADDYLTKPFDLGELRARLRALVRRAAGEASPVLRHGSVTLDPASRKVVMDGRTIPLSAREYTVLLDLMTHRTQLRSRTQLEESLYAWGEEKESNTVEVYIHHLRKKLGAGFIQTIRGFGYQLGEPPPDDGSDGKDTR